MQIKWASLAYVRYVFFYIAGIITFQYIPQYFWAALGVILFCATLYIILLFFTSKSLKRRFPLVYSVIGFLFFFMLAYCNSTLQQARDKALFNQILKEKPVAYTAKVVAPPQEKENGFQVKLLVNSIKNSAGWLDIKGKVNAYLPFKNDLPKLNDILLIKGNPQGYEKPLNFLQFDYGEFMGRKGVYLQHYLPAEKIIKIGSTGESIYSLAFGLRAYFASFFTTYISGKSEQSIALALVLGIKDRLDHEIRNAYSGAGAMHVLAVSGLHVGILFTLVGYLFIGFKKTYYGRWVYSVVSLIVLWFYAAITGFSPSVVRACTMFTFVLIANVLNRKSNIYNTLAASALCMLVYDPNFLFQVGFQLSYIAVFGIVFIQPKIYLLFKIENSFLDKLWEISAVSIAAQMATFPIGLYYFHQFPVYFLLANPIVILVATIVVNIGIMLPIVGSLPFVSTSLLNWIAYALSKVIYLMNSTVLWINQLPFSQTEPIHLISIEVWLLYLLVFCLSGFLIWKKLNYLKFALFSIILTSCITTFQKDNQFHQQTLTVYNIKKHTCISIIHQQKAYLLVDSLLAKDQTKINFHTGNHLLSLGYSNPQIVNIDVDENLKELLFPSKKVNGNILLSINGNRIVIALKGFTIINKLEKIDLLITRQNSINHFRKSKNSVAKTIIADGSNSQYYLKDAQLNSFQFTQKQGAFTYSLN